MEAKDIATIIKACNKAGVTEFKMGDINITFGEDVKDVVEGGFIDPSTFPMYTPADSVDVGKDSETQEEIENSLIAITNPELWEAQELSSLDKQEA
jgi:hypothetical protein